MTWVLALAALAAFAGNSLIARAALGADLADAGSFTAIRLASGALALWGIRAATSRGTRREPGSWTSAFLLFAYAYAFSLAYREISAGTGALILFGAVQATMLTAGLLRGERLSPWQWAGLALALGGLAMLQWPGLAAPSPQGALLMALAGAAWGGYSLRGRGAKDPVSVTADNFLRATPLALAGLALAPVHLASAGLGWAVLSGAVTSGVGYVFWYAALRNLTATRAASIQLSVPVLTALAALPLLGEALSFRLLAAGTLTLGGIALALGVVRIRR